jgi:hypothetical protein
MLTFNEAIETLFAEHINIELIITNDDDGYVFFNFRARPWKNSPNDGRMLLVGAPTLNECMILLADGLLGQDWTPLSWTARLHSLGSAPSLAKSPGPLFRHSEPERLPEVGTKDHPYTRS